MADRVSKKQGHGLPVIMTDAIEKMFSNDFQAVSIDEANKTEDNQISLLMAMTIINVICVLVFLPTNSTITAGIMQISSKKQPMFLFFAGVHISCIIDLMTCLVDVVLLWVEVPNSICLVLGSFAMSIYCFLSSMIACICFYR